MSKPWGLLVAASLAAGALPACEPKAPKFAFTHAERRGKLESNGLKFVLMPDSSTQLVEVDIRYDVGSREDPPGKAGLAHVVEHLMFQLRPDGAQSAPLMQSINELTTFFNAYTNWDTTHYMNTARAENLDAMLKIETMRMFYGCQTISNEEFLREREVVRNEIRQRTGTAEGQIPQLILSSIYPHGHAYERMIGGDDKQLTSITLEDACKFMKDYYVPERATVVIAGGIDVDKTLDAIKKWFGKLKKAPGAPRVPVQQLAVARGKQQFELDVERASVHVAFALPPNNTPDGELVRFGLGRMFSQIARKGQEYGFAYSVSPTILGGELAPVAAISIELKGMGKLDDALEFTQKAIKQAYRGFDEANEEIMELWRNQRKASFIQSMEQLAARTIEVADRVQFSKDFNFDSQDLYLFHELDKIGKFDAAKVGAVVKKYLDYDKARIIVIKPNKEGVKGDTRNTRVKFDAKSHEEKQVEDINPEEARRPIKLAAELKGLSGASRFELGNGMKVVLLPFKSMPLVATRLVFDNAGTASYPSSRAVPDAAARFLQMPFADAFDKTGISVDCEAAGDATVCESSGINIYLEVMVKGLERLVHAGTYNQDGIESWQKIVKGRLATKQSQQQVEFERQILLTLYGPDHPYTKSGVLTADAVNKVDKDTLDAFRKSHYTAGNATLIITGDFDTKYAEKLVKSTFRDWGKGSVASPVDPTAPKRSGPSFVGVVGKEEPQLEIRIAYPAPAGVDGQEGARQVLAEMMNIRVGDVRFKLGSTYGVYAGRRARKGPAAYAIGGTVDAERGGESLKAIREGVEMLRKGDTFEKDFVRARRKILSTLLGESTVTAELAQRLGFISTYNLPPNYFNTLLQQVAAVSPAQLRAMIATELNPNNEVIVVLGDKAHLDKTFADAGIKDVKIVEPEYK
ncbi:MAG: insulinase family protein [Deltaproteobacteria bacterium]|nr:insulinase family protein [Deltaproteobacteria bacterium]MCW5800923.1 insulinase family protein [Deltaproteobacteria bacterium]